MNRFFPLIFIMLLWGCVTPDESVVEDMEPVEEPIDQPSWALFPPQEEGYFFGVGFDEDLQEAKQRAMINVAQQFSTQVITVLEESYSGSGSEMEEIISSMDRQLTDQIIKGAKFVDQYQDDTLRNWILVQAPLDCMLDITESLLISYSLEIESLDLVVENLFAKMEGRVNRALNKDASISSEEYLEDEYILVRAGSFTMGSPEGEEDRKYYEVEHEVSLTRDFYIGRYEVTQGLWETVMNISIDDFLTQQAAGGKQAPKDPRGTGPNHPVHSVSWLDAVEFCNRLSEMRGLPPAYSGSGENVVCDFDSPGYRLPSEAEWEFAARGGQVNQSYFIFPGAKNPSSIGWTMEDNEIFRHEVGLKEPNELGLYDMSGNVQEWCWDVFELTYYRESPDTDPTGPDSGNLKVLRGGSFYDTEMAEYRSAARASNNMSRRLPYTGFRLVRTAE